VADDALPIDVQDDGWGSADEGSGLVGLFERVQAGEGTLSLSSPPDQAPRSRRCRVVTRDRSGGDFGEEEAGRDRRVLARMDDDRVLGLQRDGDGAGGG
jgi:hypothetical protein